MSLVSALSEKERHSQQNNSSGVGTETSPLTGQEKSSNKKHAAIYQKTGEPLSKEALYRAKMKYGHYQSPANKVSVGVKDSAEASDSAALLAHTNKQTIETYKRLLDPNATRAAHAVAKNVTRSRSSSVTSNKSNPIGNKDRASAAASKAFSMTSSREEALYGNTTVDSIKAQTNRSYSFKGASSVLKQHEKDLNKPKVPVVPTSKKMNLSKVLKGAESRAESRVKQRSEPSKNFSYGIKTNAAENNQFVLSKDMMNGIMAKTGQKPVESKVTGARSRNNSANVGDHEPSHIAMGAAYAVRDFDTRSSADDELDKRAQNKAQYLNQLTSSKVLAQARANVDKELQRIERENYGDQLFKNDAYNRTAVAIAQKNFTKKKSQVNNKINLGGGLWLSPEDIQKISQNLLNPVLGEITERADLQRAADIEIAERTKALQQNVKSWNVLQTEKNANDTKYQTSSDARILKERTDAKAIADAKYKEMIDAMEAELAEHNADLAQTKQMFEDLKLELSMKLDMEQDHAEKELANWQETRANDINDALEEQKRLLQPYLLDLRFAQDESDNLIKEYDIIAGKMTFLNGEIKTHKVKIDNYEKDLAAQKERELRDVSEQNELDQNKTALVDELDTSIVVEAKRAKEIAELSAKELELKQLEIDAAVNERKSELNATEIDLQKERLILLDVMKDSAELEGSPVLDEEKVKSLIGMTSAEFLSINRKENDPSNSKLETIAETAESGTEAVGIKDTENVLTTTATAVSGKSGSVPPLSDSVKKCINNSNPKSHKFGFGDLFMGSRAAHDAKVKENITDSVPQSTSDKVTNNVKLKVPGTEVSKTRSNGDDGTSLNPSFSGFSQGSINNENEEDTAASIKNDTVASIKNDTVANSEDFEDDGINIDEDDDIHINGETQDHGYLKEVF